MKPTHNVDIFVKLNCETNPCSVCCCLPPSVFLSDILPALPPPLSSSTSILPSHSLSSSEDLKEIVLLTTCRARPSSDIYIYIYTHTHTHTHTHAHTHTTRALEPSEEAPSNSPSLLALYLKESAYAKHAYYCYMFIIDMFIIDMFIII